MEENQQLAAKTEVNYADAGGANPCASCTNFIAPDACLLVAGRINEGATCDLYSSPAAAPLEQALPADLGGEEAIMAQLFGGTGGQS